MNTSAEILSNNCWNQLNVLRVLGVEWGKKILLNLLIAHLFQSQLLRKLLLNDRMCSRNAVISQPVWATLF